MSGQGGLMRLTNLSSLIAVLGFVSVGRSTDHLQNHINQSRVNGDN